MSIQANEGQVAGKIYATNGRPEGRHGPQFDREVRKQIVNDIADGLMSVAEMSQKINVSEGHILDWGRSYRPDFFGAPRKSRNKRREDRSGSRFYPQEKAAIAEHVKSGRMTLEQASKQYRVCPSIIKEWTRPGRRFNRSSRMKNAAPFVSKSVHTAHSAPSKTNTDRLLANPEHTRLVIGLLLNDSPTKAQAVAKALLAR